MTEENRNLFKTAVSAGNLEVVKVLLKDFESFDAEDREFVLIAAVMYSADKGTEILDYIINLGDYKMDLVTENGWTPLHFAAAMSDPAIVKYLIDHGADIEAKTKFDATPLLVAGSNTSNPDVIETLLVTRMPFGMSPVGIDAVDVVCESCLHLGVLRRPCGIVCASQVEVMIAAV